MAVSQQRFRGLRTDHNDGLQIRASISIILQENSEVLVTTSGIAKGSVRLKQQQHQHRHSLENAEHAHIVRRLI